MKKSLPLLFFLWLFPLGVMAGDDAQLTLLLFRDGEPAAGLQVEMDGKTAATANRFGGALLNLPPGEHELVLREGGEALLRLPIHTEAGANIQAIITLFDDGRPPRVDIESSTAGVIGPAAGGTANRVETPRETGRVAGRAVSAETDKPVSDATIFVSGTDLNTRTGEDGTFELELPAGTYSLSVIHPGFSAQTLNDLRIDPREKTDLVLKLTPTGVELQEFVVSAPYIEGSMAFVMEQQKESFSISEVLGAEQMARAGDGDAADAMQRVTALTVEDGKFVHIRGLPTRYSKALWNGSELPSPDPNSRVVPLDLFPTGVLKAVQVQKTYSPDLPGSFGGGLMQIETRGVPEEGFLELGISAGYNSEATFKDGLVYRGGSRDSLGIDDGTRALPDSVKEAAGGDRELAPTSISNPNGFTDEELERLGEAFPNIYQVHTQRLGPDMGLSLTGGDLFYAGPGKLGFLGSLIYSRGWTQETGPNRSYGLSGTRLIPRDRYDDTKTEMGVTLGGMLTLAAEFNGNHSLTSNTFLIRKTSDTARLREGLRAENDDTIRGFVLEWVERQLLSQQVAGNHKFAGLHDLTFGWRAMVSQGSRYAPDRRVYLYSLQNNQYVFEESSLSRRYADLDDRILGLDADLSLPLGDEDRISALLKAGAHRSTQERNSEVQTFQFQWEDGSIPLDISTQTDPEEIFTQENIGPGRFVIDDLTGANDDYQGTQEVSAQYLMTDIRFFDAFRLSGGARSEQAKLDVRTFQSSAGGGENEVRSSLETSHLFPGAAATWFMTGKMQFRLGYGKTVSRPDLKEISAAPYNDPVTGDEFVGRPDLKETTIDHFDARWEWYPSGTESLTLGLFMKEFTNPIETVFIPTTSGSDSTRSFQNADKASNTGIEFSFSKGLGFLGERLTDFYIAGNTSWIDSEVELANTNFSNTNETRPLQGQAPYVVNFNVGYDGGSIDAALLYNVVGERIAEVGVQGQPDVLEQPAGRLDFAFSQTPFKSFKYKISARNLLDPDIRFLQEGQVQRSYKKGREFGFSIGWEF